MRELTFDEVDFVSGAFNTESAAASLLAFSSASLLMGNAPLAGLLALAAVGCYLAT